MQCGIYDRLTVHYMNGGRSQVSKKDAGQGSAHVFFGVRTYASVLIAAISALLFLLPTFSFASIVGSQTDYSVDTGFIESSKCVTLSATSTDLLGDLTLYFGSNTASNFYPPALPHWVAVLGLFSSFDCTSGMSAAVLYKDSYQPTTDNTVYTFDASEGFWDASYPSYQGHGTQALATATPSLANANSFFFRIDRASTPTFSSGGGWPCSGYCTPYLLGDGTTAAYILEGVPIATTTTPTCVPGEDPECNSNVLFLPGIEASRLYIPDSSALDGNDRLWEPTSDADGRALFMDEYGISVRNDIYTKDVLDEAYGTFNIYKSFLADLEAWKSTDHIIADYSAVPYDWRLTLDEILEYGNQTPDGHIHYSGDLRATSTPYLMQELTRLATTSRTGKVTIIAHSNGGLVAKALLKRLQDTDDPLLEKIDVVIMVAVPQMGTPVAIGALLHGYDQGIPKDWLDFALSKEVAREFAYNDPMAHHLLPSAAYFNSDGATVRTPPITFEDGTATQAFINTYGHVIDNDVELKDFLLGVEGRPLPASDELNKPTVLRSNLLAYGEGVHESLDAWVPPAGVTVHQIAGWGEDTAASIVYSSDRKCRVISGFRCMEYTDTLRHKPDMVVDGDGTVVVPSALAMSTSTDQVKRWWVDLDRYNFNNVVESGVLGREHASILEVPQLRVFINQIITANSMASLPTYISTTIPSNEENPRLRFFLHSPLALSATDALGNEISAATSTIPGARYKRFGEVQYISVPASATPTLHLEGFAAGSFTLEVQEVMGDTVTATTTFLGIPNATTTTASMNFGDGTIENASPLIVDIDADGTTDITLEPKVGEMIVPDTAPPEIQITFATSTNSLAFIGTDDRGTTTISATTTYPTHKKHQKEPKGVATTTVTARDQADNTTVLVYTEKLSSPDKRDTIFLKEVSYNGATTTLSDTSVSYKWRTDKNGLYKLFASHIKTSATSTESHYRPKKDLTVIMTKPADLDDDDIDDDVDSRPAKQKLLGMIIPSAVTGRGRVLVTY